MTFCLLLKLWVKLFVKIYSQKLLDHAKQSATDALKTASKKAIQTTAEANEEEVLGEIFIPSALRDKVINELRLKEENY